MTGEAMHTIDCQGQGRGHPASKRPINRPADERDDEDDEKSGTDAAVQAVVAVEDVDACGAAGSGDLGINLASNCVPLPGRAVRDLQTIEAQTFLYSLFQSSELRRCQEAIGLGPKPVGGHSSP